MMEGRRSKGLVRRVWQEVNGEAHDLRSGSSSHAPRCIIRGLESRAQGLAARSWQASVPGCSKGALPEPSASLYKTPLMRSRLRHLLPLPTPRFRLTYTTAATLIPTLTASCTLSPPSARLLLPTCCKSCLKESICTTLSSTATPSRAQPQRQRPTTP